VIIRVYVEANDLVQRDDIIAKKLHAIEAINKIIEARESNDGIC